MPLSIHTTSTNAARPTSSEPTRHQMLKDLKKWVEAPGQGKREYRDDAYKKIIACLNDSSKRQLILRGMGLTVAPPHFPPFVEVVDMSGNSLSQCLTPRSEHVEVILKGNPMGLTLVTPNQTSAAELVSKKTAIKKTRLETFSMQPPATPAAVASPAPAPAQSSAAPVSTANDAPAHAGATAKPESAQAQPSKISDGVANQDSKPSAAQLQGRARSESFLIGAVEPEDTRPRAEQGSRKRLNTYVLHERKNQGPAAESRSQMPAEKRMSPGALVLQQHRKARRLASEGARQAVTGAAVQAAAQPVSTGNKLPVNHGANPAKTAGMSPGARILQQHREARRLASKGPQQAVTKAVIQAAAQPVSTGNKLPVNHGANPEPRPQGAAKPAGKFVGAGVLKKIRGSAAERRPKILTGTAAQPEARRVFNGYDLDRPVRPKSETASELRPQMITGTVSPEAEILKQRGQSAERFPGMS